jgi:hypothetical protein
VEGGGGGNLPKLERICVDRFTGAERGEGEYLYILYIVHRYCMVYQKIMSDVFYVENIFSSSHSSWRNKR